jgi:4-aminobutyrate aminotransferase-like enzyme
MRAPCGLYANVVRLHVPSTISEEDLRAGLGSLETAVGG